MAERIPAIHKTPAERLLDEVRRIPMSVKRAAMFLALAAGAALRAGDGPVSSGTNNICPQHDPTNTLCLWIGVSTNAARGDVLDRAGLTSTNRWLPPGVYDTMSTSSAWRTTAILETGFFHVGRFGGAGCPGYGRRSEDGWYQDVGIGMERDIDHGDSGISLGIGISVGRATTRLP